MQTDDRLITMANQIARFFESQPEERRIAGISDHINRFWEKRMRHKLLILSKTEKKSQFHPLIKQSLSAIQS